MRATLLIGVLLLLALPARAGPPEPADMFSENQAKALTAARALSPEYLTLREIRRQMEILRERPGIYFVTSGNWGVGAPDLPVLWRRIAETGEKGDPERHDVRTTHRAMLPECVPALIEILDVCGPDTFPEFARRVGWFGMISADHHELVLRGILHARERYEGRKAPPPAEIQLDPPARGVPESFKALAELRWLTEPSPDPLELHPPNRPWMRRWAGRLNPVLADVPFLARLARGADSPYAQARAVHALGLIGDENVTVILRELAALDEEVAVFAAAELARRDEPKRLTELLGHEKLGDLAQLCAFKVLPELAQKSWLAAWRDRTPYAWLEPPMLSIQPNDRTEHEALWGVSIGSSELTALAVKVQDSDLPISSRLRFYDEIWPNALTGTTLDRFLAELADWELPEDEHQLEWFLRVLPRVLARAEVRRPEKLRGLLHGWAERGSEERRGLAVQLLSKLGNDRHLDALIELWGDEDRLEFPDPGQDLRLGRVRHPKIRAFLTEVAAGEDEAAAILACRDLAEYHGLPDGLAELFREGMVREPEADRKIHEEARKLLLGGDAVAAAIHLLTAPLSHSDDPEPDSRVALLGLVNDPRAEETLRAWRTARRCYWPATAGLALSGDSDARREITEMITEGRIWVGELIDFGGLRTLRGDPELVRLWIDRIDANCCLGFNALCALLEIYPTLDIGYRVWNLAETKQRVRAWHAGPEGRFAWSRILDGFVQVR